MAEQTSRSREPDAGAVQSARPARAGLPGILYGIVRWRRRLGITALVLGGLMTFLCAMVLIGAWRHDVAIESRMGQATATVHTVSFARTIISFSTPDGERYTPELGVLYPDGLEPGQLVRVQYDTENPDLVRVAGRNAELGLLPASTTVLGVWAVLGPIAFLLLRRPRGRTRRKSAV